MLYEVITGEFKGILLPPPAPDGGNDLFLNPFVAIVVQSAEPVYGVPQQITPMIGGSGPNSPVITSYSIHYTKLYDAASRAG